MKTMKDLAIRAKNAIERKESVCFDVCSEYGQIFGNIKNMKWFVVEVMREISKTTKSYNHLTEQIK